MRIARPIILSAALLLAGSAAADWGVAEAPLRFDFSVESSPSLPSAGILVFLPDGGLLPTPAPRPTVLDDTGKPVDFDTLWHNPQEGLGLVIAKPATPGFSVYVGRQSRLSRNERSAFTPGPLFYVKVGNASLETATRLNGGSPPGKDTVMGQVDCIGQRSNPFGPDQDFSGWFSAWLKIDKAGRYYIATVSDEGSTVKIGGKTAAEWPGLHTRAAGAKGQFGTFVELAAGNHPVDYYYFNVAGPSEAQLCWKVPGTSAALPDMVPSSAYIRSGSSRLTAVSSRDGGPVALPTAPCDSYFWFGEAPVNLYRLAPSSVSRNPTNTVYEWKMDDGKTVREASFPWLYEGSEPRTVTLTVRSGNLVSTASCPIRFPVTPTAASISNPFQRTLYRSALLSRCRAVPPPGRPAADWSPAIWEILVNVTEPFKGQALLSEIFERSREDMIQRLSPADRALLEDTFMDNLRYTDAAKAATWVDRFEKEEKNLDRKRTWTLTRVELALYQKADTNQARQVATELAAQAPGTEAGVLALVRLGDIEALAGRFDAARSFYAQAQAQTPRKASVLAGETPAAGAGPSSSGLAKSREELDRREAKSGGKGPGRAKPESEQERGAAEDKRKGASSKAGSGFSRRVDPWKTEAVRGGAYYETIRDLIRDGYLREAKQELRNWEIELPTEKLGGEYPVAEADYFMALRDYNRTLTILGTYRKAVDTSPFMPKAMGMELDCLQQLGRSAEAVALAAVVLKEFPGMPVADQARQVQETLGLGRVSTTPSVEVP